MVELVLVNIFIIMEWCTGTAIIYHNYFKILHLSQQNYYIIMIIMFMINIIIMIIICLVIHVLIYLYINAGMFIHVINIYTYYYTIYNSVLPCYIYI